MYTVIIKVEENVFVETGFDSTTAYSTPLELINEGHKLSWFKIIETETGRIVDETTYPANN